MTTMKFRTVLSALCMLAVFACTEEVAPLAPEVPEVTTPENLVEMTLTASQDATKSTFDGKTIGWEKTDLVAIYDGVAKREFRVTEIDEQTGAATLKGYVDADAVAFQAVYPYSAAGNELPAEGNINITVPAVQTLVDGAVVAPGALVSVGEVVEGNITFKNAVSLLKVKVTEEMTSVTVKGVKYENIAGAATATVAAVTSEGGAANVVLKPAGETFAAGDYYIALLPTTFADGFTVAYRKESGLAVLKSGAEVEFPANGGFDVTGKDLSTLTWLTNPLMSEADLKTYLANQDSYAGEAVSLGKDITLTEAWTPVALTGNLDGAGYTISGLAVEATGAGSHGAMFTTIDTDASLKNVTVEGAISLSTSAATSYAGLAGELKGTMYKVINKASVTAASTGNSRCYPGGLVGIVNSGSIVECENHGAVTLSSADCPSFIGGLVGVMYPAGLVQNSKNYGTVTSESAKMEGIGGIVGLQQGGNVKECTNSGVVVAKAGASESYAAGIIGYVQNRSGVAMEVSGCVNDGEIQVNSDAIRGASGVCGVLHVWHNESTRITGCTNNKAITVTTDKEKFYLGGIVSRFQKPGTVANTGTHPNYIVGCINKGALTVLNDTFAALSGNVYIGGIAGYTLVDTYVEDCVNSGLVSSTRLSSNILGGVVGYTDEKTLVDGCTNSGCVSAETGSSVNTTDYLGGIVGCAKANATISGNTNTAAAAVSVKAIGTDGSDKIAVGGIVGLSNDGGNIVVKENKNYGSVLSDTQNTYCPAGGIVACVRGNLNSSDNINFGDVEVKSTTTTLDDVYCGGIVGLFHMGGSTQAAETATLLRDKSFGYIKSSGRVGLIFAASAWSNMGKIVIDACVLGGKITGKVSGNTVRSELDITADNFSSNLWSYYYNTDATRVVFENRKNCTFGLASTYDK